MIALVLIPVFLLILLLVSTPLVFTFKKNEKTVITIQGTLFAVHFLPKVKKKKNKNVYKSKDFKKTDFSYAKIGGKTVFRLLRKVRYIEIGTNLDFSKEKPVLSGSVFAFFCPLLVLFRNIIPDLCVFSLPKAKKQPALYLTFEINLFSLIAAALSFLFHVILKERKDKKYAAKTS